MRILLSFLFFVVITSLQAQNYSLQLNGTSSTVSVGATGSPSTFPHFGNTFTIEAYIKVSTSLTNNGIIACWANSATNNTAMFRITSTRKLQYGQNAGQWVVVETQNAVAADQWIHVAVVKEGVNVQLFINGIESPLVQTQLFENAPVVDNFKIGTLFYNSLTNQQLFKGEIDEVRVWNTARTVTELQANLYTSLVGNEDGLMGYWNFDSQTNDFSMSGFNAVASNCNFQLNSNNLFNSKIVNMTYHSAVCTHSNVSELIHASANNKVLLLNIKNYGSANPIQLSNIALKMDGCSLLTDINAINIYYAGSSEVFSGNISNLPKFNNVPILPSEGRISIAGNQTLALGNNYFWICYDISKTATVFNVVDALCTDITVANEQKFLGDAGNPSGQVIIKPAPNYALRLSGANTSYAYPANIPGASTIPYTLPSTFSFSAWVNPLATGTIRGICSWGSSTTNTSAVELRLEADNRLYYYQNKISAGIFKKVVGSTIIPANTWTYVTVVMENSLPTLYVNGVPEVLTWASGAAPMDNQPVSIDNFRIGQLFKNNASSSSSIIQLDEISLWSKALNSFEVSKAMYNSLVGSEPNLLCYWNFNDNNNPTIDASPNNNPLTITTGGLLVLNNSLDIPIVNSMRSLMVKNNSFNLLTDISMSAKMYWAVYPANQPMVDATTIKNGIGAVVFGAYDYVGSSTNNSFQINGLQPNTDYVVYAFPQSVLGKTGAVTKSNIVTTTNVVIDNNAVISASKALIERIVPGISSNFNYELLAKVNDELDVYELETVNGRNVLRGSSPVAIASAFKYYLNKYCNASVSWVGDQLSLPSALPLVGAKVRKETPFKYRFYMNYCTHSYTMAYWDWSRWEREIDWMALNGINLPLATIGVEAVWQNTLRKYGYTDAQIFKFLASSEYSAWWLMGNLEGLGGAVSQAWIDSRVALQKNIVTRMRELGIMPEFQGFYGIVPTDLASHFPSARVYPVGNWMGQKRPYMLDPTDTLFTGMAKTFYQETEKLFGKADFFGGDPFHEGGSVAQLNETTSAAKIHEAMLDYNPNATWVLQAWQSNPTEALLAGTVKQQTLILDLPGTRFNFWKSRNAYNGHPWVYNIIGNYGAREGLYGNIRAESKVISDLVTGVSTPSKGNLCGLGIVPEGTNNNPLTFQQILDQVWCTTSMDFDAWLKDYTRARYGKQVDNVDAAFDVFSKTAYACTTSQAGTTASMLCATPSKSVTNVGCCATTTLYYNTQTFVQGWTNLIHAADIFANVPSFQYDLVDVSRQALANYSKELYNQIITAFNSKDISTFNSKTKQFIELLNDQDSLLSSHPKFLLGKWIQDARALGTTSTEKALLEKNARQQITIWDPNANISAYAHKEWNGMLKDFYKPRWQMFFDELKSQLNGNAAKTLNYTAWDKTWVDKKGSIYLTSPSTNPIDMSRYVYNKYMKLFGYAYNNAMPICTTNSIEIPVGAKNNQIIAALTFTDADANQNHTFQLFDQNVPGALQLDNVTGVITVGEAGLLNGLTSIIVSISDNGVPVQKSYKQITVLKQANAVSKLPNELTLEMYPNPATDILNVNTNGWTDMNLELKNQIGQSILNVPILTGKNQLNISKIPTGIYFVVVKNKTNMRTLKLNIVR